MTSIENQQVNEIEYIFDKTSGSPAGPKMSSGSGFGSNFTPESLSASIVLPEENLTSQPKLSTNQNSPSA